MNIPDLRSPREMVGGIVYLGRMFDKIRLHSAGKLPPDYIENLGSGFDERMLSFLHLDYAEVVRETLSGKTDAEILAWSYAKGHPPSEEEIEIWNAFMSKRGWRDEATERLLFRKAEAGFADRDEIQTFFDFIEADEE